MRDFFFTQYQTLQIARDRLLVLQLGKLKQYMPPPRTSTLIILEIHTEIPVDTNNIRNAWKDVSSMP